MPIHDIHSKNANVRGFAQRNSINYPIQGSAADIIKVAMLNIFKRLNDEKLKSKLIMQVHDELVFEVSNDEIAVVKELIRHEMESAVKLYVPLKVDINYGKNWSEAH